MVIDQRMRPKESYLKDESDEELNVAEGDKLKPPFLITCRPTISAYILQELNWSKSYIECRLFRSLLLI